jgi:integrase
MATFKAVVLKHQQRSDERYPISIRITNNRKTGYISTGIYATASQINKRSFEIKDSLLILKTNAIIKDYQNRLLELDANTLREMTPNDIKEYVTTKVGVIDYMEVLQEYKRTHSSSNIVGNVESILHHLGVYRLPIVQFTSAFIDKFKAELDRRGLADCTKNNYLINLCAVFKYAQSLYNTEFTQRITHNPFYRLEGYKRTQTKKRNISVEQIRYIFARRVIKHNYIVALDAIKISFCLCGVNLKDLYDMKDDCLKGDRIEYNRGKTKNRTLNKSFTSVKIQPEIEDIIKRRRGINGMLFDFREQYKSMHSFMAGVNFVLNNIGQEIGINNLTSYYFRHSWATIARNKCGVSNDDIDLGLVHSNKNKMADVYIDIDYSLIDNANRKVLDLVFGKGATEL